MTAGLVRELLVEYGQLARRGLNSYVNTNAAPGTLHHLAADYPSRGGRSLRASLCIAAAKAFGARVADAVQSAVALELLHNAFLVHDDVEDDSEERRGRPALHVLHGVPTAVNVGDGLAVLSLRPLIDNRYVLGPRVAFEILSEAQHMAEQSVEGQALELKWRDDNQTELACADYLRMVKKKTCWYTTIYPCRVGALIGKRTELGPEHFVRFGFFLGAAFQIQDDVLNLIGDPCSYGKELNGDIWEGKRTLAIIHLLNNVPEQRGMLRELFSRPRHERSAGDVRLVRELMDRHGSIEYARRTANELAGAASFEFELAFSEALPSRDKDFIAALPRWVLERS